MSLIKLYDTTLRDGTQAEDISFLVQDKIRIAQMLDDLGVHYVEGGWRVFRGSILLRSATQHNV